MDQQRAQVGVAALRDAEEPGLAARRRLTRDEAEPSGKITGSAERLACADRCDQRRRVESAEARDGGKPTRGGVLASTRYELGRKRLDATIQLAPLQAHVLDQKAGARAQERRRLARPIEKLEQVLFEATPSLGDHDAALQEHSTKLIDQCRALADQARPGPVQDLRVELSLGLELDEAHRRPRRRLRDGLGISFVVLLRLRRAARTRATSA